MRRVSRKTRRALLDEPDVCARKADGHCSGRLTWEHTLIFAGRQLDEPWSIIKLCAYHHAVDEYQDGGDLQKEQNIWLALNRATNEELQAISKAKDYVRERERLNGIYGHPRG